MMKNKTIYLAKITKSRDYDSDITLEMEAFEYMSDAEKFMNDNGLTMSQWGVWASTLNPFEIVGTITTLRVN
jgi:hypothetical protein